jgi:hypothetical protein
LYAKADDDYMISYKDFASLYPFTNYNTEYPVGHPDDVYVCRESERDVHWTTASQNRFKGILKVLVLPPQHLKIPVLPLKLEGDGRLLFPLCRRCCELYPTGKRISDYKCVHSDQERMFVTTVTHLELNEALDSGYAVHKLYRYYDYSEAPQAALWDADLFKSYVNEFMKIKLQASGWPLAIEKEECAEKREELKQKFIDDTRQRFGIDLEREKIDKGKNAGLRYIAKLALNSLR